MKGKVIRGKGFYGLMLYLLLGNKKSVRKLVRIIGGNLLGRTPKALTKEFTVVRRMRPDCEKPVLHIPFRLPHGDSLDPMVWGKIVKRYFELMELSPDRPWVLIQHDDHVHLATSRISYAAELWHGKWEGLNHINATQTLEKEFNMTRTPGLEGADANKVRVTSGQMAKYSREVESGQTPEIPGKIYIAESIESALAQCDGSMDDFKQHLAVYGVTTQINQGKTSLVTGISYSFGEIKLRGSKVGRAYSWNGINKLLKKRKKQYEQQRNPQQNAPASTLATPEHAAPSTGDIQQNLDVSNQNQTMADRKTPDNGHSLPVVDGRTGVATAPPQPDAKPTDSLVPAPSATPTDERPVEREAEPAGPGHHPDLQVAQGPCPGVSETIASPEPELTPLDEPEQDLEQNQPPPILGR